jgi:tRNA A-37 threonylcarbamoyl transferase component Bud32
MIIAVDFDGTLALGNKSHISILEPNHSLINKLKQVKREINPTIKIVTARGAKANLPYDEKVNRYHALITEWLQRHGVPYDEISFNKEYASLYIDDMTITQDDDFEALHSCFTGNKILFTPSTVIKNTKSALLEFEWYKIAERIVDAPKVLFCNDELIITERIHCHRKPNALEMISIIQRMRAIKMEKHPFETYMDNLCAVKHTSDKVLALNLPVHQGTMFHGDLSTQNVLVSDKAYCIDPNYKSVFGSYLTDAGKAYFSFIAYERNYTEANKIKEAFGDDVLRFAVAEGLRVCKYKEQYISIVNNIADIIE